MVKKYLLKNNFVRAVIVLICVNSAFAKTSSEINLCKKLYEYRDNELYKDFEEKLNKYKLLEPKIKIYQSLRLNELSNDNLDKIVILKNIDTTILIPLQTLADALETIVPPVWVAAQVRKSSSKLAQVLFKNLAKLKNIEQAVELIKKDTTIAVAKITFAAETGYLGQIIVGLSDMTVSLIENINRAHEWDDTVMHFKQQIKLADIAIAAIEKNIKNSELSFTKLNYIKNTIDKMCNGKDEKINQSAITWASIENGVFILKGSSKYSGKAMKFINGYADYCIWGEMNKVAQSTGDNYGQGLNKKMAKIDKANKTLRFRPGEFIYSGSKYKIFRTENSFVLSGKGRNQVFNISNNWSNATFGMCGK